MTKLLIAIIAAATMLAASTSFAVPASAQSLEKFCWKHPYAPICWDILHHHHHHHDDDYYYWYYY